MALFERKNKKREPEETADEMKDGKKRSGKGGTGRKKSSGMCQILHESVTETAVDEFQQNDTFIVYDGGKETYVGIVLDTADIGGLDKKSRKDEAKGSIIECINSGRLKTYITSDLMDAEMICFIPDAMTLSAMSEFSLLTDAPYELCEVDEDGNIELLGLKTNYIEISDLVLNDQNVDTLLKKKEAERNGAVSEDDDDDFFDDGSETPQADGVAAVPFVMDDDEIPDVDAAVAETATAPETEEYAVEEVIDLTDSAEREEPEFDPYAAAREDMPEETVDGSITDETVVRKFYSDDLGLEVTSEPFDAQFMQSNPYVPFDEDRGDGWLDKQLNEMSRNANHELAILHRDNIWQMRERYFKLVALACDRIREDLDVYDPGTQYGEMYAELENEKTRNLETLDRRVQRRKQDVENAWKQRLQEVGMEAARAAQHQYRERYTKQHEQDIYNIEASEKAAIEAEYQDSLHEMYDRRKTEAAALLDISITDILDEISDMYMTALTDEHQRYEELEAGMLKFAEENREADIAHTNALAEELRQSEKADRVLAEQTAKMQNLSEEYREKREQLLSDMEDIKRDNAQRIALLKQERQDDEDRWNRERTEMDRKYSDLLEKYQNLDDTKEKEFSARFEEMKAENDALADRNDHLMEVHRRSNLVSVFLLIAITIAALSIGFIGGEFINTQQRTEMERQQILTEYQLDSLQPDTE